MNSITNKIADFKFFVRGFEETDLFDKETDRTNEFLEDSNKKVSSIFRDIQEEYISFIEQESNPAAPLPNYRLVSNQLVDFLNTCIPRTEEAFKQKIEKKRFFKADSKKQKYIERQKNFLESIRQATQHVVKMRETLESTTREPVENALNSRVTDLKNQSTALRGIGRNVTPLAGTPSQKLFSDIRNEKDQWNSMIEILKEAGKYKKTSNLDGFASFAEMFCAPSQNQPSPLRMPYAKFQDAHGEFESQLVDLQFFGNRLLESVTQKRDRLNQILDKYTPVRLKAIKENRVDLRELKKDYEEISVLIFYLRQMMDVSWGDHPFSMVRNNFDRFFLEVAPLIDNINREDGIASVMAEALHPKLEAEDGAALQALRNNEMPAPQKTFLQKAWDVLCLIFWAITFQWLFDLCRKESVPA